MRTLLAATVKNEGPFLLEWVAWHGLLGFDDIVIAQNDSFDLTTEILGCLDEIGAIHFLENSDPGTAKAPGYHQGRAYRRITALPVYAEADWAISLDADEFLAVTIGRGRVADLIERLGNDVDQIHIHWNQIGSGGFSTYEDDLVTSRFREAHLESHVIRTAISCKTLFRTSAFETIGVHRPLPQVLDAARAVTASGVRLESSEMKYWGSKDPGGGKYAKILHYQIRDAESYVLSKLRGRPSPGPASATFGYWAQADCHDRKIDLLSPQRQQIEAEIKAEIARLDAASGGKLMMLHRQSVAVTRERIAAFKADPASLYFYEEICRLQSRLRGADRREALIELYEMGEISWRPS
jgi:hypothetical protein